MEELMRTNNPVTLSYVQVLLTDGEIVHFVADQNMSIAEGSIGILSRRIMVDGSKLLQARRIVEEAGLGAELPEKPVRPIR